MLHSIDDASSVSLWPYVLFSMHKHCLVIFQRCGVSFSLFSVDINEKNVHCFPPKLSVLYFLTDCNISASQHLSSDILTSVLATAVLYIEKSLCPS